MLSPTQAAQKTLLIVEDEILAAMTGAAKTSRRLGRAATT